MEFPVNLVIDLPDAEARKLLTGVADDNWERKVQGILTRRIVVQLMMSPWYTRHFASVRAVCGDPDKCVNGPGSHLWLATCKDKP